MRLLKLIVSILTAAIVVSCATTETMHLQNFRAKLKDLDLYFSPEVTERRDREIVELNAMPWNGDAGPHAAIESKSVNIPIFKIQGAMHNGLKHGERPAQYVKVAQEELQQMTHVPHKIRESVLYVLRMIAREARDD